MLLLKNNRQKDRQKMHSIILASSSIYRKELLSRLKVPFNTFSPDIDESRLANESIPAMVERLSQAKANAGCLQNPESICIGSDVVAGLDDLILGKPETHENAIEQLAQMSGNEVIFYTGVCVSAPSLSFETYHLSPTKVRFKKLTEDMIEHYLQKEKPYQSAGSFKAETLAIALLESYECEDPTAIIGLPLIFLSQKLIEIGVKIF